MKKIVIIVRINPSAPSLLLKMKNIENGIKAALKKKVNVCFVIKEVSLPVTVIRHSLLAVASSE
jgi:hypothetical protein